jgi:hypothetical protein
VKFLRILDGKRTRNLPGSKGRPALRADNLTAICEPIVYKMWEPRRVTTLWAFTACYRDNFTLTFYFYWMALLVFNIVNVVATFINIRSSKI